jgi:hypothetical protein
MRREELEGEAGTPGLDPVYDAHRLDEGTGIGEA